MYQKVNLVHKVKLSSGSTIVKFGEGLEFTVTSKIGKSKYYQIENIKGDFQINKIEAIVDEEPKSFLSYLFFSSYPRKININILSSDHFCSLYNDATYIFYISANIELKERHAVTRTLFITPHRLKLFKPYQFYKENLYLPECDAPLVYYVKKIGTKKYSGYDTEIHIVNPYDIEIEGKKGDYKVQKSSSYYIDLSLSFVYDPAIVNKQSSRSSTSSSGKLIPQNVVAKLISTKPTHITIPNISRPQSPLSIESKFYKIFLNEKLADIFLVSSDNIKISTHRCVLATFSKHFEDIFNRNHPYPYPMTIDIIGFNAETIKAPIEFLYGKTDSIIGKELDVFKFALEYRFEDIIGACRIHFEESVDPSNVCEYIQIAYSNNFQELKQKCLKILVEKKKEIAPSKFADLPKKILTDFFAAH